MSFYRGMTCENVTIKGDKGTPITAYVARPIELTLETAKELRAALDRAIAAAELEEAQIRGKGVLPSQAQAA